MTNDETLQAKKPTSLWMLGGGIIALITLCVSSLAGGFGGYYLVESISPIEERLVAYKEDLPPLPGPDEEVTIHDEYLELIESWEIRFEDDFSGRLNGWGIGHYESQYQQIYASLEDGKYRIEVLALDGFVGWRNPNEHAGPEFYLEVTGRMLEGEGGQYGLIFQQSQQGYYYFAVDPGEKEYEVDMRHNNTWKYLLSGPLPNTFSRGFNKLAVLHSGDTYHFFINDILVDTLNVHNDILTSGEVGIIYSLDFSQAFTVFEFDNFILRKPD